MTSSIKWIPKGWGGEKIICNNDEYCGKILCFVKGKKCSWHYHIKKDETFYVQSGKILLKYSESDTPVFETILNKGDSFHVYRGLRHQMIALEDTELFEFSTPDFEEDSIRVQKGD
jgi:quercetin dioxygenase-like cupin family protein